MPWLFKGPRFTEDSTRTLFGELAKVIDILISHVEVHLEETRYRQLNPDGKESCHIGVHATFELYSGIVDREMRGLLVLALEKFLCANGLGNCSDVTFAEYPEGAFWYQGAYIPHPEMKT